MFTLSLMSWWSRRSYRQTSIWERSEGGWEKRTTLHTWLCYAIRPWAVELKARRKSFCDSRLGDRDSKASKYHKNRMKHKKNERHEKIAVHHFYHLLLPQFSGHHLLTGAAVAIGQVKGLNQMAQCWNNLEVCRSRGDTVILYDLII